MKIRWHYRNFNGRVRRLWLRLLSKTWLYKFGFKAGVLSEYFERNGASLKIMHGHNEQVIAWIKAGRLLPSGETCRCGEVLTAEEEYFYGLSCEKCEEKSMEEMREEMGDCNCLGGKQ